MKRLLLPVFLLLYQAQGRYAEAEGLEARAKAIRARPAERNPVN